MKTEQEIRDKIQELVRYRMNKISHKYPLEISYVNAVEDGLLWVLGERTDV